MKYTPSKTWSAWTETTVCRQIHLSWKHSAKSSVHWWWCKHQNCCSQCCIWRTIWKGLGLQWNQDRHKAERLRGCHTANHLICMWNLNNLSGSCKESKPLPHRLSEKPLEDQMKKTDPGHRGRKEGLGAKHTYSSDVYTAKMGWLFHQNAW